ncbi:MAG TPA: hypothetical protein VGC97_20535 [Pyrinomonadaceae bacterium]
MSHVCKSVCDAEKNISDSGKKKTDGEETAFRMQREPAAEGEERQADENHQN